MARYSNAPEKEITFEIREQIGVIAEKETGWNKELNLVSWNGAEPPKYDVRDWSPDHMHMARGITLFEDEMRLLVQSYLRYKGYAVIPAPHKPVEKNPDSDIIDICGSDAETANILTDEGYS